MITLRSSWRIFNMCSLKCRSWTIHAKEFSAQDETLNASCWWFKGTYVFNANENNFKCLGATSRRTSWIFSTDTRTRSTFSGITTVGTRVKEYLGRILPCWWTFSNYIEINVFFLKSCPRSKVLWSSFWRPQNSHHCEEMPLQYSKVVAHSTDAWWMNFSTWHSSFY